MDGEQIIISVDCIVEWKVVCSWTWFSQFRIQNTCLQLSSIRAVGVYLGRLCEGERECIEQQLDRN